MDIKGYSYACKPGKVIGADEVTDPLASIEFEVGHGEFCQIMKGQGHQSCRQRTYRRTNLQKGWVDFTVRYRQSDLWIQADRDIRSQAERVLLEARMQVEGYVRVKPDFLDAHKPMPFDPSAPPVVQEMLKGSREAGVGPMAAVAGAIAHYVGERVLECCGELVVENGGDLYLSARRPLTVGILAGESPFSSRLGLRVAVEHMPVGVSTSSASVGHSWSYGAADAACVAADHGALADAAATALCNRSKSAADMQSALGWVLDIAGVRGALLIQGKTVAAQGEIELVSLESYTHSRK